jgi:ribosome modulation factor
MIVLTESYDANYSSAFPSGQRGNPHYSDVSSLCCAFDEGTAAAARGDSFSSCPYTMTIRADLFTAWRDGFRAFHLNGCTELA